MHIGVQNSSTSSSHRIPPPPQRPVAAHSARFTSSSARKWRSQAYRWPPPSRPPKPLRPSVLIVSLQSISNTFDPGSSTTFSWSSTSPSASASSRGCGRSAASSCSSSKENQLEIPKVLSNCSLITSGKSR